jgi:hypothetical protein
MVWVISCWGCSVGFGRFLGGWARVAALVLVLRRRGGVSVSSWGRGFVSGRCAWGIGCLVTWGVDRLVTVVVLFGRPKGALFLSGGAVVAGIGGSVCCFSA